MKLFKKLFILLLLIGFFSLNISNADMFWSDKVISWLIWTTDDLELASNKIIWNFLTITYFVVTLFVFYWAFNIFTAAWDEEKVKKWKTIITHTVIWFVIIFLVGSIVKFIFDSVTTDPTAVYINLWTD
jgi:NADH:ubiquinone oxidoreductase subunit 5 (subunit L)/multisubunit Na+/H+ antiporter MnhA subunit